LYRLRRKQIGADAIGIKHGVPSYKSVIFGYNSFLLISKVVKMRNQQHPSVTGSVYGDINLNLLSVATFFGTSPGSLTTYENYFPRNAVIIQNGDSPKPLSSEIVSIETNSETHVSAYFTQNPAMKHPKVHVYPRAVSNLTKWESLFEKESYCEKQINLVRRKHLLMCTCLTLRKDGRRQSILDKLLANGFKCKTPRKCVVSFHDALFDHKFVLSPWGGGHSNHREWEALLAGAIPLVDYDPFLSDMFLGLPVIFVRDWSEITPKYLRMQWKKITFNSYEYDWKKLYAPYWFTIALNASLISYEDAKIEVSQ